MKEQLDTPVLFLIFNRADTTKLVFDAIRAAKPKKLYIAADGPRKNLKNEKENCAKARAVVDEVDWECEVHRLFRDENLGLRKNVGSAIDWFFENELYGIILEDDCLPDHSFFYFCQSLLEKHKDSEEIMHIGGNNFQPIQRGDGSYYFSKISHIWGWATWRRAWKYFDPEMKGFPQFVEQNKIADVFEDNYSQKRWISMLQKSYKPSSRSWAYPWSFSIFNAGGICITPNKNLVTNIGFGIGGTHSLNKDDEFANLKLESIIDIKHPSNMIVDQEADRYTNQNNFKRPSFFELIKKVYLKGLQMIKL